MQTSVQTQSVNESFGSKAWKAIKNNFVVFFAGAAVGGTATYLIMREPSEVPAVDSVGQNPYTPNYATIH
jgi:hypothetical protein